MAGVGDNCGWTMFALLPLLLALICTAHTLHMYAPGTEQMRSKQRCTKHAEHVGPAAHPSAVVKVAEDGAGAAMPVLSVAVAVTV
jgi:hypothetical protein